MAQIDIGTKLISALRRYSALMCNCRTVGTGHEAGGVIVLNPDFGMDQLALSQPKEQMSQPHYYSPLPPKFSDLPASLD